MSWKFNAKAAPATGAAPAAAPQPAANVVPPPTPPAASSAPAALPAFQPSPDPTPPAATAPAAATVAAPAAGRRRRATAPEVAAPAQVTAPIAHEAPPAPAAAVLVVPAGGGMLARMVAPAAPVRMAVTAVMDTASQGGGEPNLFPTLMMKGGNSGGMLQLDSMNEDHSDDDLQEGTRPMQGILMGYRMLALCWPKAYDEKGPKIQPLWRAIIGAGDYDSGTLLTAAFENYTFREDRPEKEKSLPEPKWDAASGGPGHPAAAIELLMFDIKAGLICVRSTWTFDSFASTSKEVRGVWPDGVLSSKPVILTPTTEMRQSKRRQWNEHYLKLSHHMSAETQAAWTAFKSFVQDAGNDPDLNQALTDWQTGTLNDKHMGALDEMSRIPRR